MMDAARSLISMINGAASLAGKESVNADNSSSGSLLPDDTIEYYESDVEMDSDEEDDDDTPDESDRKEKPGSRARKCVFDMYDDMIDAIEWGSTEYDDMDEDEDDEECEV